MSIIDDMMKDIEAERGPELPELLRLLKEWGERHNEADRGPRFPVGSLITPAKPSSNKGEGEPNLVVAVRNVDYEFRITDQMGSPAYGSRPDTRVLWFNPSGAINAYWVDSAEYIEWTSPAVKKAMKRFDEGLAKRNAK
jgi:hypothetical protein